MTKPSPNIAPPFFYNQEKCPVRNSLASLCNKWSLLILTHLSFGTHRFSELLGAVPDISQRMLTQNLRMLESMGMIDRVVTASIPPRVDYSLTKLGESFLPSLLNLLKWGIKNKAEITENVDAFSTQKASKPHKTAA